MRILQVVFGLPPLLNNGGASRSTYELSVQLAKRGHEVTVFTTDKTDLEIKEKISGPIKSEQGFDTYVFKNVSQWLADRNITYAPGMAGELRKAVSDMDVIHLHEYRHTSAVTTHRIAKRYGVPYVFQARGTIPVLTDKGVMKRTYDMLWGRSILKDSSRLIALTSMEEAQYLGLGVGKERIDVIPNAFDAAEYISLPERGAFRARMGIGAGDPMVLYLGRINRIKGIDLLIRSFIELSRDNPSAKLVIAGPDDGYLGELVHMVDRKDMLGKVLFCGPLHGREKVAAFLDADVYVLPSTYEIFGKTILESCACGTPVVITKGQGLADAVDGKCGIVVDPAPAAMRDALEELLGDDGLRSRLGDRGRLMVREDYSWETVLPKYERTYASCINEA